MAKFEVKKFDGHNNFNLWRVKMKALLRQQGLSNVLDGKVSDDSLTSSREEEDKAYNTILLSLSNGVLREVADEETASGLWTKLESLDTISLTVMKSTLNSKGLRTKLNLRDTYNQASGLFVKGSLARLDIVREVQRRTWNECPKLKNKEEGTNSSNVVIFPEEKSNDSDIVLAISSSNSHFGDRDVVFDEQSMLDPRNEFTMSTGEEQDDSDSDSGAQGEQDYHIATGR
ncbi:hypothetical protein F2P56_018683 [Juglans regia]|uniref:Retrovirus-related Pol polyprotein from transposon TNT 1-94 n=2 Tax=Juglans regia TaxID=51240 RepID=A0A833UA82_JUGRE|nr:uncharacterized protein LOC108997749 [Juglans regia]KAF5462696.1 hypothetical protein F2P56_018683 [Juglans regia]